MKVQLFSTTPHHSLDFWQLVLLPTISIFRKKDDYMSYTVVNFEWLFWNLSIYIK